MLFSEVYGSYFRTVEAILAEAADGTLTDAALSRLVREKAFGESALVIPAALRSGTWPLLTEDRQTPLRHKPAMPMTALEKRWLKSLLCDARIRLFSPSAAGLADVKPLYPPDAFIYFDRYGDGDPYDDSAYIAHFQVILAALREKRKLHIVFDGRGGLSHTWDCVPYRLEYSAKDDKFRLITASGRDALAVNLSRIRRCELREPYTAEEYIPIAPEKETLLLELHDERNALERVMLHFSHLEKETVRMAGDCYRITLHYDRKDTTELLIRVLSFGPVLRVLSPDSFVEKLKARLEKQTELRA